MYCIPDWIGHPLSWCTKMLIAKNSLLLKLLWGLVGDSINQKDLGTCLVDESEAEHHKLQEGGSVTKEKQTHQVLKLKSMTTFYGQRTAGEKA